MNIRLGAVALSIALALFATTDVVAKGSSGARGTGSKSSSTQVRGHTTKSGQYVAPHRRTTPDKTQKNNYSAKGNVNPNNGKVGKRSPKR